MDNSDYDTTRYNRPAQRALEGRQKLAESAARNRPNDKQKKIKVKTDLSEITVTVVESANASIYACKGSALEYLC